MTLLLHAQIYDIVARRLWFRILVRNTSILLMWFYAYLIIKMSKTSQFKTSLTFHSLTLKFKEGIIWRTQCKHDQFLWPNQEFLVACPRIIGHQPKKWVSDQKSWSSWCRSTRKMVMNAQNDITQKYTAILDFEQKFM